MSEQEEVTPSSELPAESSSPKLVRAKAAFSRGDYRHTREICFSLLDDPDEQVREQAARLIEQMKPSGLSLYLYTLTFAILCLVTLYAYFK